MEVLWHRCRNPQAVEDTTSQNFSISSVELGPYRLYNYAMAVQHTSQLVRMQDPLQEYTYVLSRAAGKDFAADFTPDLSPQQMLELGVFGGNYFEGYYSEYPKEWFAHAKISLIHNPQLNYFGVDASQSREVWQQKGWIHWDDPRGWFQWYCRYYLGRRLPGEDYRQIKRWKLMARHVRQVQRSCQVGDELCRPRQRQALLHWAYDSRKI